MWVMEVLTAFSLKYKVIMWLPIALVMITMGAKYGRKFNQQKSNEIMAVREHQILKLKERLK